jgi:hypothetical protein
MELTTSDLIGLAIAAAGPLDTDPTAWGKRVEAALPHVKLLVDSPRLQERAELVNGGSGLKGTFVSLEAESSTNRYILTFKPDRGDENEQIRTDFVDTATGRLAIDTLRHCRPGDELTMLRVNEPMRGNAQRKVRVLYAVRRGRRAQRQESAPAPPAAGASTPSGPPPSPSDGPEAPAHRVVNTVMEEIQKLTPGHRTEVIARCKRAGIKEVGSSMSDEEQLRAMAIIATFREEQGEPF